MSAEVNLLPIVGTLIGAGVIGWVRGIQVRGDKHEDRIRALEIQSKAISDMKESHSLHEDRIRALEHSLLLAKVEFMQHAASKEDIKLVQESITTLQSNHQAILSQIALINSVLTDIQGKLK